MSAWLYKVYVNGVLLLCTVHVEVEEAASGNVVTTTEVEVEPEATPVVHCVQRPPRGPVEVFLKIICGQLPKADEQRRPQQGLVVPSGEVELPGGVAVERVPRAEDDEGHCVVLLMSELGRMACPRTVELGLTWNFILGNGIIKNLGTSGT